ncbi:MAG: DUF4058 family protein [Synechococcales bacterium]|nr:DUF4058 family protein [Synechococcales bacterium]
MPSPFPGMNPYLENPTLWPEIHSRLIIALADALNPQIIPKYRAALDRRVYDLDGEDALLVGIPDVTVEQRSPGASTVTSVLSPPAHPIKVKVPMPVEMRESFLKIQDVATQEVVTVIEILSPANKRTGRGRRVYEDKRLQVLGSRTHLVEIDLLRGGKPMTIVSGPGSSHYRILVSRGNRRPSADLYAFNLQDRIPLFPLPLKPGDAEPIVDLRPLLDQVYDRAGYELVVDYAQAPVPPLSEAHGAWVRARLTDAGISQSSSS